MPDWIVGTADERVIERLSEELLISRLKARLLYSRGVRTEDDASRYLQPSYDNIYDPFLFDEMEGAVSLIKRTIDDEGRILVHGDYDADGICGATIMFEGLRKLGADVHYFIPDRRKDGYGLARRVMDRGIEVGLKLVISVDCGSSDREVIGYLRSNGVDVIVTDHHNVDKRIDGAEAFLNPKLPGESYPFKELAGVGVAYKLLQGLEKGTGKELSLESMLDLVALGTLGDYVSLHDENRTLVSLGLDELRKWKRAGLRALRDESRLPKDGFSSRQICFTIIPRLNSPGRIGSGKDVLELLIAGDDKEALVMARDIEEKNRVRREHDSRVTEEACFLAEAVLKRNNPKALVFSSASWHEGVVGISAARLAEKFNLPSALIAVKDGIGKGSARSAGKVNVKAALEKCSKYLKKYGGHEEAGGFSIAEDDIVEFQCMFEEAVGGLSNGEYESEGMSIDAEITLEDCNKNLIAFIEQMEPLGPGNREPVFLLKNQYFADGCRIVGDGHLKMETNDVNGDRLEFIGFSLGKKWDPDTVTGGTFDLLVHIRKNSYMGSMRRQIQILDMRRAGD